MVHVVLDIYTHFCVFAFRWHLTERSLEPFLRVDLTHAIAPGSLVCTCAVVAAVVVSRQVDLIDGEEVN